MTRTFVSDTIRTLTPCSFQEGALIMAALDTPCMPWLGRKDRFGYGRIGGRLAHRVLYEENKGPIPVGLTLDHLCHNADISCRGGPTCPHRPCVNLGHLEPATRAENSHRIKGRRTHCPLGHPYDEANTRIEKNGARNCKECNREQQRRRRLQGLK